MNKFLSFLLRKAGYLLLKISRIVYIDPSRKIKDKWKKDDAEKLRLDYNLNENSVVFDLGGYEGQWASDIFSKYLSSIYIFEVVKEYADKIDERFKYNKKIKIFPNGLYTKNCVKKMILSDNSTGEFRKDGSEIEVDMVDFMDFIVKEDIKNIDLMKINIEGGEYELLEYIIETGFIKNIKNIQIQFHNFFPDAEKRMKNIQGKLAITHKTTYQYEFVWENWELKE